VNSWQRRSRRPLLIRDLPLATFNLKDFTDFAEHESLILFR
jgi:hypothetical protein